MSRAHTDLRAHPGPKLVQGRERWPVKHKSPAALCRATGATRDAAAEDGLDRRIACAGAALARCQDFLTVAQLHEIALHAAEAMLLGCGR